MENFCGSPFWDSNITWYTDNPKFTPCFEKTVLIWIPCAFLWIFAPFEITNIFKSRSRHIPWNFYNIIKLIFNILLILISALELSYAIYKKVQNDVIALVEIFTPSIKIISFSLVLLVSQHNKYYGRRSSGLLFIFWLLFTICGLPQFRTEIEKKISQNYDLLQFISYVICYSSIVLKFLLNCFADKPPLISSNADQEKPCPEFECSFLSRILYYWFDPLVRTGFKRPLVDNDLWSLDKENTSAEITLTFERHWNESLKKTERRQSTFEYTRIDETNVKKQASILPALFKTFGFTLLITFVLELIHVAISFSSPFFLSKLISFISDGEELWKGYMYAIVLFISVTFRSLIIAKYSQVVRSLGMGICTALISAVYKKSLKLSSSARKDSAIGEIVNLMSVDVQKFNQLARFLSTLWSAPLQICISMYLLWRILGPSVFSGLGVIVLMLPLNAVLVRYYEKSQSAQMEKKDQRLKLMNEILNGIKVLKLYAWEPSFEAQITKIRNEEMKSVKRITYFNSAFSFIWLCIPFLVSLVIFATFVLTSSKNILDSKTAFVALSLLNILQFPLTMFPYVINNLIQTYVSTKRINKFMNSDEINPSIESLDSSDDCSLRIEDGSFSWDSEEPTLKDINIDVKARSLVAIVGNVGSGKSSILSAVLGEMEKLSGQISIRGSIAYVAQQAWIQNETLKNNILFRKNENEDFYNSVVDACALKPDLEMLPAGDQTEIGEKGINLSGGQKQRVSLARAVYFDSDVYLLDDPLSAVDSHVGKHIFEHVIGPKGLLNKKTRLLVTNAITYLPQVDHIVVLKDGTISECGTYKELLEKKGSFADFLIQYISSIKEEDSELLEIKKHLESNLGSDEVNSKLQRLRSMSENESDNISNKETENTNANTTPAAVLPSENKNDKFTEEELIETGNIKWHVYVYYFKKLGLFLGMATLLSNFAFQAFSIASNVWLSKWSSSNDFNSSHTNDTHTRDLYLGVYGALGIGQAFASYFYNLAPQLGFWWAAKMLHEKLLSRILRSPSSFFDTTPSGRILSRFSKDVDILDETLPWIIAESAFCIFSIMGTLVVISISTPLFISVILPIAIVYYFIQRYYIATTRQLRRLESVTRSPIYSHFQETLTGVSTVKAFGLQDTFIFESQEKVDYNNRCKYGSIISSSWLTVRLEVIGNLIILFSALFAIITRDKISPGIVGLSVSYALQITENLTWVVNMVSELETNIVAVERIKEYSENVQEKPWVLPDSDPNSDWPPRGQLDINNLVLRYRSTNEPVLHEISCQIKPGEKVGVVGRTGAGKSSLALALFRIVEAESGSISIDGLDISQLGLHTLRSRLSIIPQDPVLFMGSLRFNLDPFDVHTDEEIWSSLELAHLKSHVESLSTKLEHVIDEAGSNLSVGQKQLICLARALLRKSSILVLDEATAAVDLETDDLIQQTIRSEFSSCTILTIAHRLNTVLDSDKILVLDKGRLVEFDSPSNLLQNQDSLFYKLAKDANIVK